VTSTIRKERRV